MQQEKTHLYTTFTALDEAENAQIQPYKKALWRSISEVNFKLITTLYGPTTESLEEELGAARKARSLRNVERRKKAAREKEERANVDHAKSTGATAEW